MSKKNYEFEGARAGIRETATRLFTSGGIHASSLADIAKAAKLSKGTLYYYYPTKEYLVMDIAEHHLNKMRDTIFSWIDALNAKMCVTEALVALIHALLEDEAGMQLHFVLMCEAMRGDGALRNRFASKNKEWCVMLEVGLLKIPDSGAARVKSVCKSFFALFDGCALHRLMGEDIDANVLLRLLTEE